MIEIVLPWPPAELSPNGRAHWAQKAKKAKQLKQDCWTLTKASGASVTHDGHVPLHITFRPASKRRQDLDNMLARAKYALDGIALALGVDDCRFRLTLDIGEPIKGGAVVVRI